MTARPALDRSAVRHFFVRLCRDLQVPAEVGVRLMDDAGIQRLNRDFRGHNTPTDVLSFPASPGGGYLGDIAISRDTAARQARAQGHSLETEIKILLLHGVLHLLGHDHETDGGAMRRRERALRLQYGLPPGLIERGRGRNIKA
ncbi:MAG TPA: rRNA maturation RNase YbeY [Terriglobales bacterium]|jgi:probable rRNA maturation factor